MHIAVLHKPEAHTTGNYFRKALAQHHQVSFVSQALADGEIEEAAFDLCDYVESQSIDFVLCIDPIGVFFPIGLEKLTCPTAIYLIDVHRGLEERLKLACFFDYVFVAQCDYLNAFRQHGIEKVFWLPLACDPDVHGAQLPSRKKLYDIGFVGYKGAGEGERSQILETLSTSFKLNDLDRRYAPEEIGTIYSQSNIVFNWSINGDVNMRVFEALCSGRLLLTNNIPNGLLTLFKDREHIVVYHNTTEMIELVHYYLEHAEEREKIALAGQKVALENHTYAFRASQILSTVFNAEIPQLAAVIRCWPAKKRWESYAQVLSNLRQPQAVLRVAFRALKQGEFTVALFNQMIISSLKFANAYVPMTPNAIRNRFRSIVMSNF